jgi:putative RNA 2'-phosphotransferase
MNTPRSPHNLNKMLAYVLGRRPDEFGLIPDADGFVRIRELLQALHEEEGWGHVKLSHLQEVLLTVPAPAFELMENRIRPRSRSAPAPLDPSTELPKLLYAFIRRKAHFHVHANGIRPSSHPQVVLCEKRSMAERLGRRIDPRPVILTVNVACACQSGAGIRRCGEGLYLADDVPAGCFSGPPLPEERPGRQPDAAPQRPAMRGSYLPEPAEAAAAHVPPSLRRLAARGRKVDRKRLKKDKWSRETPPWRK